MRMHTARTARHRRRLLGVLALLGLVLAACGGNDGDSGEQGGGDTAETADVTVAADGDPQGGGKVTMAVEAETDGFDPTSNRWAISGFMVANAVFDPLTAYDAEGTAQPYLAESLTPSADFSTWTMTMRSGITFHNGQPLDGAAVKKDLDLVRASALTGASLANIESVEVDPADPLAVVVTMTQPWASFPATLVSQVGFIAAPAQLDAEGAAASRQPIGTGPFVYQDWVPDRNWIGTKNPNYWRTDESGTRLPYLDEVEFVPVPDNQNRVNGLLTGDVQLTHVTNWPLIAQLRDEADAGRIQFVADRGESEESFVMFNTQVAPVDDPRVRQAAALCTDREIVFSVSETPAEYTARTQYKDDSPWYNPDAGFPEYDVAAATELVQEVEAEKGPIRFTLGTTPVPENRAVTQVLETQWDACGMEVELVETEQSKFITDAVLGSYQANLWRQFGAADPDADYVWWTGKNANPPGSLALNIARLRDAQIDAALDRARASDDPEVRKEAYAEVQARQSELVPYVWLGHTQWAVGAQNDVRNIGNQLLPDGQPAARFQVGTFRLTEMWLQR
jgi:peptide/nickel transport system substrate-binding protein